MSKILIVEDEESIAELEKDYLELSGFEVEIENDGSSGLDKALKEDYDLLILDAFALPGLHILLAQSAIKSGDLVCLYHKSPFPTADKHGFVLFIFYHTPLLLSLLVKFC